MEKIVFLDRDGTINIEADYLYKKENFEFIPRAVEAISLLNMNGYKVVVVTNQAGISKGLYEESDVIMLHQYIQSELKKVSAWIDEFYYCPYHINAIVKKYKKQSACRKPGIGMFQLVEQKYEIDKKNSWMIGDAITDIQAGVDFGVNTILVSTGYGEQTYLCGNCKYDYYMKDLYEAVKLIVNNKIL